MHIEYVVASYMGDRIDKMPEYEADRAYFLRCQLASLEALDHSVKGITIVHNESGHPDERFLDTIPMRIRDARVRVIRRPNVGFSYGAYVEAIGKTPQATHFILMEDDYVFQESGFDAWMLERMPHGMLAGAVWDWAWEQSPMMPTAAVFLGMVHADAIRSAIELGWHGKPVNSGDATYKGGYYGQVALSQAIVQAGYELRDWLDERATAFWNSSLGRVDLFTECRSLSSVVVPIQAMGREVPVVAAQREWKNQRELRCRIDRA